ncbi:MAG: hypothetical protein H7061_02280 [Bdellovibrionaceae bacterium]|nr:hypothetical protein [Bdellovibrio sp.]
MKNIIVVDNFYQDPLKIRNYALNGVEYLPKNKLSPNFPGTESVKSFTSLALIEKIESSLGQKINVDPTKYSFGVFTKTYLADSRNNRVHVDTSEWTGIVYLNLPEQCQAGTSFYEHKLTGLNSIPYSPSKLSELGYNSQKEFVDQFLRPQSQDQTAWKQSVHVGMKFNRLILFKAGELFHSAGSYFGHDDQSCRLTQLFFFSTASSL